MKALSSLTTTLALLIAGLCVGSSLALAPASFAQAPTQSTPAPSAAPQASSTQTATAAQAAGSGTLRGSITDPSKAAIVGASIQAIAPDGSAFTGQSGRDGNYEIKGVTAGTYTILIQVPGFNDFEKDNVVVNNSQIAVVNASMVIAGQKQQVEVQGSEGSVTLDVSPENNAGALILKGKDLDALSDDPDELTAELQALAGPSAGPNGGQIYIDGFTGGQIPPKASIREIRINQNPFSAEYDKLGYGRIEIFTKPGTDKFHGQFLADGNDSAFNSRNPFALTEPPYFSTFFSGNVNGPITKKASFFFDAERRDINNVNVINAEILDSALNPLFLSQSFANPSTRTTISPRVDWQLSKNNTLVARYRFVQSVKDNQGIGQFSLSSQGYNETDTENVAQITDTQVISSRTVNETRFQYTSDHDSQISQNFQPTLSVLGAFTSGGNTQGNIYDDESLYELQNYTSMSLGKHALKFGGRLRVYRVSNQANSNFNGTYTFSSLGAYETTLKGLAAGESPAEIRAMGGGASQFFITAGTPQIKLTQFDFEPYVQDDWHLRPSMTLSMGLRYETQNKISDHKDFAPRLGFAWGLGHSGKGGAPKTVIRGGFGFFYDRFLDEYVEQAERFNGINQQQFDVNLPNFFPAIPPVSSLTGLSSIPTIDRLDPHLRAPYTIQSAVGLERQVTKNATAAVTYINSHGEHQLLSRNINAPLPGTYDPAVPTSGVRPFGTLENIYNFESDGLFNENQLIANFTVRVGTKLSLFGYYALTYANSDTSGATSFPADQYDLAANYGRASFDVRNRVFVGGTYAMPWGVRVSPFLIASSGSPFNITVGQDLNGDSIFNDRPSFATGSTPAMDVRNTAFGDFDLNPTGEDIIPPNFGTGPGQFTMNLRVSKTVGLGKKTENGAAGDNGQGGGRGGPGGAGGGGRGGGGAPGGGLGPRGLSGGGGGSPFGAGGSAGRRYSLTFSVSARNLFNNVNVGPLVGNLDSPLFGRANALGGVFGGGAGNLLSSSNRRIDLQMTFSF
jgi:Carboxypeptidase regulatory-like domain